MRAWLQALWPAPVLVDARQRLRAVAGAFVGILVAGVVSRMIGEASGLGPGWWRSAIPVLFKSALMVLAGRDDLEARLHGAESAAYARNMGQLRCDEVDVEGSDRVAWSAMKESASGCGP